MKELSFDVGQKSGSANPEQFVGQPGVAQLLLDQHQPRQGVLGSSGKETFLLSENCLPTVLWENCLLWENCFFLVEN
jgi:hypothetical protein